MAIKVVDIADEVHRELGSPSDLSIAAISYWLRTNIGQLNNLLYLSLSVDSDTLEFSTDLTDDQCVIFKKLYIIHYYDTKVRSTLGAAGTDSVVEVSSDGARVRKINKNELSKTWLQAKNQEYNELKQLISAYVSTQNAPIQIAGDDTTPEGRDVRVEDIVNRTRNAY